MALPPVLVELKASAGELHAKLDEAEAHIEKMSKNSASNFDKLAAAGKGIALAVGGGALAIGAFAIDQADQFEEAHARLDSAIQASGGSFDQYGGQIGTLEKHFEGLGYSHAQVEDALSHMVVSTQDPTKAIGAMGVAADLAAMKHIDLSTAADAVDKAMTGNLRPLKQLGIDLPIAAASAEKLSVANDVLAKKQDDLNQFLAKNPDAVNSVGKAHDEYVKKLAAVSDATGKVNELSAASSDIMGELGKRLGGQAAAQAETFHGKLVALEAKAKDWGVTIGMWLIPKIEELVQWLQNAAQWLGNHQAILIGLATVVGTIVVAALVAWAIAATQAAIAQALALAPVIAVVAALAALVAAVVYAYQNWDFFRNSVNAVGTFLRDTLWPILQTVFAGIVTAAQAVVTFVQNNWPTVQSVISTVFAAVKAVWDTVLHPVLDAIVTTVSAVVQFFVDHWDQIRAVFQAVFDAMIIYWNAIVVPYWDALKSVIGVVVDYVTAQFNDIVAVFKFVWALVQAAWDTVGAPIFDKIKTVVGVIVDIWRTEFEILKTVFSDAWSAVSTAWDWANEHIFQPIWQVIMAIVDAANQAKDAITSIATLGGALSSDTGVASDLAKKAGLPQRAGGGYLDPGWNLLGERGAELVNRNTGQVLTAGETRAAMTATSSSAGGLADEHVDRIVRALGVLGEIEKNTRPGPPLDMTRMQQNIRDQLGVLV